MNKKFWMCMVGNEIKQFKHLSYQEAIGECERLARGEGKTVYLLEAMRSVKIPTLEPPVTWDVLKKE